jgi:FMN phosphatase YigB (HAD superfamily)
VAELARILRATPFLLAPGAVSVLRELAQLGYALGVISNTVGEPGRLLRPMLASFGFDEYVGVYTFSDEHPWAKPAPEIFRATLRALGSKPSAALHVGDSWSDMEGARRAGMLGGVLFIGLQRYGERYRQLFTKPGAAHLNSNLRATTLSEVVPLARRLLPTPRARRPLDSA